MADVFISYKREDRDRIAPLARALEARGYTVWWDLELVAGQKWAKQIKTELDAANCVIVAWTRVSVAADRTYASEFVENEADEALRRGVLVPALMDPGCVAWTHQKVQYASLIDWSGEGARKRRVENDANSPPRETSGRRNSEELTTLRGEGPRTDYKYRGCFTIVVVIVATVVVAAIFVSQMPIVHRARDPETSSNLGEELRPSSPTSDYGLEFYDLSVERDFAGAAPVLVVSGEVRNISNDEKIVPPVRVSLRAAGGREVFHLTRLKSKRLRKKL